MQILGHSEQLARLEQFKASPDSYTRQAFLFQGPKGSGKLAIAKKFAEEVSDTRDIMVVTYTGTENHIEWELGGECDTWPKKDTLAAFNQAFAYMGFQPKNDVCRAVIFDVQRKLPVHVANALLKKLEEILNTCLIIMVVPDGSYIVETINSRCKTFAFGHLSAEEASQILINDYEYTAENADKVIKAFGTDMEILTGKTFEELDEIRAYMHEHFANLSAYSFIEIWNLAYWIDQDFEAYLAVLITWANGFMYDPEWSPKFSALIHCLTDVYHQNPQNRAEFVERALIKYLGWNLPTIRTSFGDFN